MVSTQSRRSDRVAEDAQYIGVAYDKSAAEDAITGVPRELKGRLSG